MLDVRKYLWMHFKSFEKVQLNVFDEECLAGIKYISLNIIFLGLILEHVLDNISSE